MTYVLRGDLAIWARSGIFLVSANAAGVALRLIWGRISEARAFPASAATARHSIWLYASVLLHALGAVSIQTFGGLDRPLPAYFLVMYAGAPTFLVFGWLERDTFRHRERAVAAGDLAGLAVARIRRHHHHRR